MSAKNWPVATQNMNGARFTVWKETVETGSKNKISLSLHFALDATVWFESLFS